MRSVLLVALAACAPSLRPSPSPSPSPAPVPAPVPAADPAPVPAADPDPAPVPVPASASVPDQFIHAHNSFRAKHCAPPLTWSTKLAAYAQHWADTLRAKGCVFGHSGGPYGENLAAGTQGVLDPAGTVAYWYSEIKAYHFPDGGFSMQTGHFTQLVWRGTKQVGCGHTVCKGNDIWVCEYDPPGNWDGEYRDNVLPASCRSR